MTRDFHQCGIWTGVDVVELAQPPLSLETPYDVLSVA